MILLYITFGAIIWVMLLVAFGPKKSLIKGGWDEKLIDAVKRFFHTTHLYKS